MRLTIESTLKLRVYPANCREVLGSNLPGVCGPGSCRGPQHEEKILFLLEISHYIESCIDSADSQLGQNSFARRH